MSSLRDLLILVFTASHVLSLPIDNRDDVIKYLEEFGYMPRTRDSTESLSQDAKSEYIKQFQRRFNLPVTGQGDPITRQKINSPRCGEAEPNEVESSEDWPAWKVQKLSYKIVSYPNAMSKYEVTQIVADAYHMWSQVIPLDFEEDPVGPANLNIYFAEGPHQDVDHQPHKPFDGPGRVLGHAQKPLNGDACFDATEQWANSSTHGLNLLYTALHEIGHSIGIRHIDDPRAIMHAFHDNRPKPELTRTDILSAQKKYGSRNFQAEIFDHRDFTGEKRVIVYQKDVCYDLHGMWDRVSSIDPWNQCIELFEYQRCAGPSIRLFPKSEVTRDLHEVTYDGTDRIVGDHSRSYRSCDQRLEDRKSTTTSSPPANNRSQPKVLMCHYSAWDGFADLPVENLDPFLCTHVIYTFAGIENSTIKSLYPSLDLDDAGNAGAFRTFTDLKKRNPSLKTMIAIGGWEEGSAKYSEMASTHESRMTFVGSVVDFLEKYNFDGVDLDWNFPASRGGKPEDKANLVSLLSALDSAFQAKGYILSLAVPSWEGFLDPGYDFPAIHAHVDYIKVRTFNYHGSWKGKTGLNAPLYGRPGELLADKTHNVVSCLPILTGDSVIDSKLFSLTELHRQLLDQERSTS